MSTYRLAAATLIDVLKLDYPPVAIAPISKRPEDIPVFSGTSPSACAFWREAETRLFAVKSSEHMNCPIGAHVMGFALTPEAMRSFEKGLSMMCEVGYLVGPKEAEKIPALSHKADALLYGPLSQFPVPPEEVVLWVKPSSAMLLREATSDASWLKEGGLKVLGRPGCAALSVSQQSGEVAFSMGCTGMRTFTEIPSEYMLAAIPGKILDRIVGLMTQMDAANCAMQGHYNNMKQAFSFRREYSV